MSWRTLKQKRAYMRDWYAKNKKKVRHQRQSRLKFPHIRKMRKETLQKCHLRKAFGMTLEQYEDIAKTQKGVCAISGKPPGKRRLAVDHDHESGKNRGLLHHSINSALGLFEDNPEWLEEAARYLRKRTPRYQRRNK